MLVDDLDIGRDSVDVGTWDCIFGVVDNATLLCFYWWDLWDQKRGM